MPKKERPQRPVSLNGEHGAMWSVIDFTLDEVRDLRSLVLKVGTGMILGLLSLVGALAVVAVQLA